MGYSLQTILTQYNDDCITLLRGEEGLQSEEQYVLSQLGMACLSTSESALLLVENERLLDAETLVRAVSEGTIKYRFLCLGDKAERQSKLEEYWNCLPEINMLKHHARAEQALKYVENPNSPEWEPLRELLLKPEDRCNLLEKYPERNKLESKWSYNQLIQALHKASSSLEVFDVTSYNYAMSSHFTHVDADALKDMAEERKMAGEERRKYMLGHGTREINDLAVMGALRAEVTFNLFGAKMDRLLTKYKEQQDLLEKMTTATYL